jgi:outer membrane protein OmpA-like peptidoglycan-associated protein
MRILVTGCIVFVIWAFFSAWLYNDIILPAMKKPVAEQSTIEPLSSVSDSLNKIKESMPRDLLIYFEFNKAEFKPDPQNDASISEFKNWLAKYPTSVLSVMGYTDLVGTPEYNQNLGLKRAQTVQKYLEGTGIPSTRINAASGGENLIVGDYITEEGRAKNRRTVVSVKM